MSGNSCCPELEIIPCSDTDDHSHIICGYSKAILENETIKTICIGNHRSCLLQGQGDAEIF